MKLNLREKAIELRKKGCSYNEITREIPVAKSTLSLWLRSVGLSKKQEQRLTTKKLLSAQKGGKIRRQNRIEATRKIFEKSKIEIGKITKRELWLLGVALYWAEGTKEKAQIGAGVHFTNSDPKMIALFLKWLELTNISKDRIYFEIYIHQSDKSRIKSIRKHWSEKTCFPIEIFNRIYFKSKTGTTNRKNVGILYFGVLKVKVRASSELNRQIAGWVSAINEYWGIV